MFQILEDSDTSLLLSLNHPQPAVRVLALQHLKDVIETSKVCSDSLTWRTYLTYKIEHLEAVCQKHWLKTIDTLGYSEVLSCDIFRRLLAVVYLVLESVCSSHSLRCL